MSYPEGSQKLRFFAGVTRWLSAFNLTLKIALSILRMHCGWVYGQRSLNEFKMEQLAVGSWNIFVQNIQVICGPKCMDLHVGHYKMFTN